jgi:hypothetical protein
MGVPVAQRMLRPSCPLERCLRVFSEKTGMAKAISKDVPERKPEPPTKPKLAKRKQAREKLVTKLDKGPLF